MSTYAFILGRNPELSLEELIVVLGPLGAITDVTERFLIFKGEISPVAILARLGGTVKVVEIHKSFEKRSEFTRDQWIHMLRSELRDVKGKFLFGASIYGGTAADIKETHALGVSLKKYLKSLPLSARFVSNSEGILSSVAVQKNNLINRELVVLHSKLWYAGLTVAVQDFDAYGLRDYGRPSRNMLRGMLPPKLAQILLNLAEVRSSHRLLDPFCGGGTILQEALVAGLTQVWGSDKDPSAIAEAGQNFDWLQSSFGTHRPNLAVHDVHELDHIYDQHSFDAIITEPFLGPARLLRQRSLTRNDLAGIQSQTSALYNALFRVGRSLVKPGGAMAVIFPVFRLFDSEHLTGNFSSYVANGWEFVPPRLTHYYPQALLSSRGTLVYSREDQVVARELTLWRSQLR